MPHRIEAVAQAIEAFKAGRMVAVTDDDDRENEGDLNRRRVVVHAGADAFIIRHTSASSARRSRPRTRAACGSTRWWPSTTRPWVRPSR